LIKRKNIIKHRIKQLSRILLVAFFVLGAGTLRTPAQSQKMIGGGVGNMIPLNRLGQRFMPTESYFINAGWRRDEKTTVQLQYYAFKFDNINKTKMTFNDLKISLAFQIVGLIYDYEVIQLPLWTSLYLTGGFTLNKWAFTRKAYSYIDGSDSTSATLYEFDDYQRDDWSWGGCAGLTLRVSPFSFLHMGIRTQYHFVIAELWPALKLDMEKVSGLEFIESGIFIEISKEF